MPVLPSMFLWFIIINIHALEIMHMIKKLRTESEQ